MAQNRTNWKEQYLRILTSGLSSPTDYAAGVELINGGYATGRPIIEYCSGSAEVREMLGFCVTTKGRLFADELASQTRSARLRDLMIKACIAGCSAVFGAIVTMAQKALIGC